MFDDCYLLNIVFQLITSMMNWARIPQPFFFFFLVGLQQTISIWHMMILFLVFPENRESYSYSNHLWGNAKKMLSCIFENKNVNWKLYMLTFKVLVKIVADCFLRYVFFSFFRRKLRVDISGESSADDSHEISILIFSEKIKEIYILRMSAAAVMPVTCRLKQVWCHNRQLFCLHRKTWRMILKLIKDKA